jgi:hypothetical protein
MTVDLSANSAKADAATIEAFGLQISGQQAGVCVNNKLATPQKFTLRFAGLTEPEYDVYVNGTSKGSMTGQQLQQGVTFDAPGSIADQAMITCMSEVTPRAQTLRDALKDSKVPEEAFISDAMRQILDWLRLTMVEEQSWKSVRIVIAPKDRHLETMEWIERHSDYDTAAIITNTAWSLQQVRDQIYHQIKDRRLRNDAIAAMTPVELTASYAIRNGKPHLTAKLLNKCDLPLKGAFTLGLPKGWKAAGAKMNFGNVKSGQTYTLSCDLVPTAKSVPALKEVPVTATIYTIQLDKSAALNLTAAAKVEGK